MKPHLQRSSTKKKRQVVKVTLLVVVGGLLLSTVLPGVFNAIGSVVVYPVARVAEWVSTTDQTIPVLWRDKLAMQEEINELQQQIETGRTAVTVARLEEENDRLRAMLQATSSPLLAAGVVAGPDQLPYDLLQIDQGTQDGVVLYAPVYSNADTLIGMVSAVYRQYAIVTLFSAPRIESRGYLAGPDLLLAYSGIGGGVMRVSVPQGVVVRKGDVLYAPIIDPGVLGQVVSIETSPTDAEQFAYVIAPHNIRSLRYVTVGDNPLPPSVVESEVVDNIDRINQRLQVPLLQLATATSTATTSDSGTATTTNATSSESI